MTVGGSLISTFLTSAASFFSHFSFFSFISIFSVFLSLSGKPHNTIHQNSATLFCHHQNYPKKKNSHSRAAAQPWTTHHKPIGKTITYPHQHYRFNSTTADQPSNHRINPTHQTPNPWPNQLLKSQTHTTTIVPTSQISNQIPNPWKRKKMRDLWAEK